MYIIGISAFYHDSAACLVQDGEIVAAAQEERFTRKKHDPGFPRRTVAYCLAQAGIGIKDLKMGAPLHRRNAAADGTATRDDETILR